MLNKKSFIFLQNTVTYIGLFLPVKHHHLKNLPSTGTKDKTPLITVPRIPSPEPEKMTFNFAFLHKLKITKFQRGIHQILFHLRYLSKFMELFIEKFCFSIAE